MSAKKRLSKNAGAIRALAQANSAIRKSMIGNASKDFISCLVLCAQKIIKGQVNVSSHHLKKLRPFETLASTVDRQQDGNGEQETDSTARRILRSSYRSAGGSVASTVGRIN